MIEKVRNEMKEYLRIEAIAARVTEQDRKTITIKLDTPGVREALTSYFGKLRDEKYTQLRKMIGK